MLNIKINNIGILNTIDIDIEGITVVGAKNDSGKSTISKVIGTSLLSINRYKDVFNDYINEEIKSIFFKIEATLQNNTEGIKVNMNNVPEQFRRLFDIDNELNLFPIYRQIISRDVNHYKEDPLQRVIKSLEFIMSFFNDNITKNDAQRLSNLISEMKNIKTVKMEDVRVSLIMKFFSESFSHSLVNFHKLENAEISVSENENKIFQLKFDEENIVRTHAIGNSSIKNVAYIESPQVIDSLTNKFMNNLNNDKEIVKYSNQLEYMLLHPLEVNPLFNNDELKIELLNKIHEIIEGEMKIENNGFMDEFYFQKGGYKIETLNVATGIKSFSIIQLLLNNNWLSEETLLVIDEPEINLHPEWQVKYAEILVLLQKHLKCNIYLNTHSSYMIESIELFTKIYKSDKTTNFYILQGHSSKKLKDNLTPIFDQLNGAFDILDARKIKDFLSDGE